MKRTLTVTLTNYTFVDIVRNGYGGSCNNIIQRIDHHNDCEEGGPRFESCIVGRRNILQWPRGRPEHIGAI